MEVRLAGVDDLTALTELRVRFLAERRGVEPGELPDSFREMTSDWLRRQMEAGTGLCWLAERDGAAVGAVTLVLLDLQPWPEDRTNRDGYVVNLYVEPAHRRQGIARVLLDRCLATARELPVRRLFLHATAAGRPLYESLGFTPNPRWLELRL